MVKHAPLFFGLLILVGPIPTIATEYPGPWTDIWVELAILVLISMILIIVFFSTKHKYKYVAIGKEKLIVKTKGKESEYSWPDVERITLNRFMGLYKLKIKNEDEIYFTPYGMVTWITGDHSDMGAIINRMKGELRI